MKIEGTTTTVTVQKFDVRPTEIFNALRREYWKAFGIKEDSAYIDPKKGVWCIWHNGHGSGLTEELRKATDEEKEIVHALSLLQSKLPVPKN